METVRLPPALGHAYARVYIAQFDDVRNGAELKDALIAASKSPEGSSERRRMDYAFVDARLVVSRQQLLTATIEAIVAAERVRGEQHVGFKTPSIHSEILWALNPNNNVRRCTLPQIADALRRFGVSKTTTNLLLVHVAPPPPDGPEPMALLQSMISLVHGNLLTEGLALPGESDMARALAHMGLASSLDVKELGKVYKLTDSFDYARATPQSLEPLVCSTVATKFLG